MLQFEQSEVESELNDCLKHGDKIEIARATGIHESIIKQSFNPDDERKSAAFVYLQIQCALDDISPERGEEFWNTLKRLRELSMKRKANGKSLCAGMETGKLNKEVAEIITAFMSGKSPAELLKEVDDAEKQLPVTREAILCAAQKIRADMRGSIFSDIYEPAAA